MGEEESKTKLAEERTAYAEDRTVLANERTFAGWMRTGLGGVAVGLAFQALFEKMEPAWVPKAIATAFLVIAVIIFYLAQRTACTVMAKLHAHEVESVGGTNLRLIAYLFAGATVALIAALWLVRVG